MEQLVFPFYELPLASPRIAYVCPRGDMTWLISVASFTGETIPCLLKDEAGVLSITPCVIDTGSREEFEARLRGLEERSSNVFVMESLPRSEISLLVHSLSQLVAQPLVYAARPERVHAQVSPYGPSRKGAKELKRKAFEVRGRKGR